MPRRLLLVTLMSLLLSVLSAALASIFLQERIAIFGSFVGLQLSENPGVAFGITFSPLLQIILIGAALLLVLWMAWHAEPTQIQSVAFGLIIGGAIGNLIDRIPDGHVTDYFQVGTFPIFNVADSCITIGVGLLLLQATTQKKKGSLR